MQDRTDLTVPVPGDLNEAIEEELEYGDSKAGWVRDAIQLRIRLEEATPETDPTEVTLNEWENLFDLSTGRIQDNGILADAVLDSDARVTKVGRRSTGDPDSSEGQSPPEDAQ